MSVAAGGALAALPSWPARAAQDLAAIPIEASRVADHFYRIFDSDEAGGGAVSVLIGDDGILLVDAEIAPLSAKVEAAIRKLSAAPIRYLINTHVHPDQTGGNEHFARLGATVIARAQVRERMTHPRLLANGQPRAIAPAAALPVLTYTDSLTLHFAGEAVELTALPDAHTDGDTLVYFPAEDILVAGDAFRPIPYPSINRPDGGTLQGTLEALALIIARSGPRTRIITSHGPPVDRSAAVAQRAMVLQVRDRVAALIAQGRSADQVVAANVTADVAIPPGLPHTTAEHFVRDLYAELAK